MLDPYRLIGERLREARRRASCSRREVQERMRRCGFQLSIASLKDFEDGRRMNLRSLFQLAEVLDVPAASLLGVGTAVGASVADLHDIIAASDLNPLEREFMFAGLNHVALLRSQGSTALAVSAATGRPPATAGELRRTLQDLLAHGGAFSLKELQAMPPLSGVPEHLLLRETQDMAREGVLQAVTHRPLRFCLRPERMHELGD